MKKRETLGKTTKKFNLLDIATADFAFEAFGKNPDELFENSALAMSDIMTDTKKIKPKEKISFKIKSEDLKALMFDFLSELLFIKDAKGLVFSKFSVKMKKINSKYSLSCTASGEKWDRNKHEIRTEVKAATYSEMNIKQNEKTRIWRAQVVLDV